MWMVLIFCLSSQSGQQSTEAGIGIAEKAAEILYTQPTGQQVHTVHFNIRKLAHIGLFFVLGVLAFLAFSIQMNARQKWVSVLVSVLLISIFGFFDEWHKLFIAGRHFDIGEVFLNVLSGAAGVMFALVCVWVFMRFNPLHKG